MYKWLLFACLFMLSGISQGNDSLFSRTYSPLYADTILKAKVPPVDLDQYPALHPEKRYGKYRYDIQPIVFSSYKTLVFTVFLICMILFLLVKFLYPDFYAASMEGFVSLNFFTQYFRSNEYGDVVPFLLMAVFRCLVLSLAVLLLWGVMVGSYWGGMEKTYLKICFLLATAMSVKILAEYLFNFIAGSMSFARVYFVQVNVLFNIMSFLLLPFLLIMFFIHQLGPQWVYGILITWASVSALLYLVRSMQVVPVRGVIYYLHFILYICAFEIIPWLLLARIVWNVAG